MATSDVSPQLLEKYLQNRCTDSEKEMVETWYASLNGERNYLDKLNALDREKIRRETLELIKNRINKSESTQVSKQFTWRLVFGIAASLLLIAGFFVQHQYKQNAPIAKTATKEITHPFRLIQFVNNEPRIVMHSLPDGSTVWMHSEASITYPEQFEDNKRLVTFQGEGFFDVKKDKSRPFSIQSGEMVIKVLGTSFNVKAPVAKKVFQISVVTGSVEVTAPNKQLKGQMVILKPQQEVFFETLSRRLRVSTIPVSEKKEIYQPITVTFKDTPLNLVIAQLQKKFNMEIVLANPEMATCQVSADFEQQSLPLIMEMLCTTLDAHYTI